MMEQVRRLRERVEFLCESYQLGSRFAEIAGGERNLPRAEARALRRTRLAYETVADGVGRLLKRLEDLDGGDREVAVAYLIDRLARVYDLIKREASSSFGYSPQGLRRCMEEPSDALRRELDWLQVSMFTVPQPGILRLPAGVNALDVTRLLHRISSRAGADPGEVVLLVPKESLGTVMRERDRPNVPELDPDSMDVDVRPELSGGHPFSREEILAGEAGRRLASALSANSVATMHPKSAAADKPRRSGPNALACWVVARWCQLDDAYVARIAERYRRRAR